MERALRPPLTQEDEQRGDAMGNIAAWLDGKQG